MSDLGPAFEPGRDLLAPRFELYFGAPDVASAGSPVLETSAEARARIRRELDERIRGEAGERLYPLAGAWGEAAHQTTRDVLSVTFSESLEGTEPPLSAVQLTLHNVYDAEHRTFRYTDARDGREPLIDYGTTIALRMGYPMQGGELDLEPVFYGVVTSYEASFPADGEPTLSVSAVDLRDRLRVRRQARPFSSRAGSVEQVVSEMAALVGMKVATASEQRTPLPSSQRMPADSDLLRHIMTITGRAGLELTCFGDTLFVERSGDLDPPRVELRYRQGLKSFEPRLDTAGRSTAVRVNGRNATTGERVSGAATLADVRPNGRATDTVLGRLMAGDSREAPRERIVTNHALSSDTECERLARAILMGELDGALTAKVHVLGDTRLRIRSSIRVGGVGRFDGDYYITSSRHVFGEQGYQTELDVRRNTALSAVEEEDA